MHFQFWIVYSINLVSIYFQSQYHMLCKNASLIMLMFRICYLCIRWVPHLISCSAHCHDTLPLWVLFCSYHISHIHLTSCTRNLIDTANIAALAALMTYRKPECTLGGENSQDVVVHDPEVCTHLYNGISSSWFTCFIGSVQSLIMVLLMWYFFCIAQNHHHLHWNQHFIYSLF